MKEERTLYCSGCDSDKPLSDYHKGILNNVKHPSRKKRGKCLSCDANRKRELRSNNHEYRIKQKIQSRVIMRGNKGHNPETLVDKSVYVLISPVNYRVFYVGSTVDMDDRLNGHTRDVAGNKPNKGRKEAINQLRYLGLKPIMVRVFDLCSDWKEKENLMIRGLENIGKGVVNKNLNVI